MKREILFRGKRVDNGEWVEGNYIEKIKPTEKNPVFWCCFIQNMAISMYEVIPETVGQFTGVLHRDIEKYKNGIFDKNGMEMPRIPVYEDDIIEFKSDPSFYVNASIGDRYIIEYYGAGFFMKPIAWGLRKLDAQNYTELLNPYQMSNMSNHYVVIGNIHDNPELIAD